MRPTSSILEAIDFKSLISLLDLDISEDSVPTSLTCPFCHCKKTMTVYPDSFYKSHWFHCISCGNSGDPINIASQVWQVEDRVASDLLLVKNVIQKYYYYEDLFKIYKHKCLDQRKKHNEFWKAATSNMMHYENPDLRDCLRELRIPLPSNVETWKNGMGKLMGFASKKDTERAIAVSHGFEEKLTGAHRPFVGGWKNVVIVPFYDLPGRIREFVFYGYVDGQLRTSRKFLSHRKIYDDCCSLSFLDSIIKYSKESNLVLVENLEKALMMHASNFRDSKDILPLVAISDVTKIKFLLKLLSNKLVIWNPEISQKTLKAIHNSKIDVRIDEPNPLTSESAFRKMSPKSWCRFASDNAIKPIEVIEKWAEQDNLYLAQSVIGQLEFSLEEEKAINKEVYPKIKSVLKSIRNQVGKTITVRGEEIQEKETGWWSGNNCICEGTLKIYEVYNFSKNYSVYSGYVRFRKKRIKVFVPKKKLQDKILEFIASTVLKHFKKVCLYDKSYESKSWEIALKFNDPKVINRTSTIGWYSDQKIFQFARMALDAQGNLCKNHGLLKVKKEVPTDVFTQSGLFMSSEDFDRLTTKIETNKSIWAMAAFVLSNMLAPALRENYRKMLYYGRGSDAADLPLSYLGCKEARHGRKRKIKVTWTEVLSYRKRKDIQTSLQKWMANNEKKPYMMETSELEAASMLLSQDLDCMHVNVSALVHKQEKEISKIVPAFTKWLLTKYGLKFDRKETLLETVFSLFEEWLNESAVCSEVIQQARETIVYSSKDSRNKNITKAFFKLCSAAVESGYINESVRGSVIKSATAIKIKKENFYSAGIYGTFEILVGTEIQQALDSEGIGADIDKSLEKDYWAVSPEWWDLVMKSTESRILRISI